MNVPPSESAASIGSGGGQCSAGELAGDGLTVTEATPSQGSYNAQTGVWDIGGIAVGAAPFLQITRR
jgi:hypothetical protein